MNYLNAKEILPPELFAEIQKYAGGNLLYVPLVEEKEKQWGEVSGQKQYYRKRNRMIQNKFLYGVSVEELAKEYNDNGLLEEWIHTYLLFERKNKAFSDGLYLEDRYYLGPLAMPLSMFVRSSGPEKGIKWQVHRSIFMRRMRYSTFSMWLSR